MTKHTLLLHRRRIAMAVLGACILASTASANAQLREKLPQDSIVFVEFAGSDRTHKACLTTPFGQMMNDPGMKSLTKTVWSAIKKKIAEEGAKNSEAELAANAQDLLLHLWKKGFALNLSNIQMGQQGPDVSLVFATPVGLHSKKFVDSFEFLLRSEQKLRPEPVKVEGHNLTRFTAPTPVPVVMHYGVIDGTFVFMIGNNTPTQVIASMTGSAPNLASNKSLQKALETIGTKNRTLLGAIHIDVATILDQGEELFKAMGQEGFPPMVKSILDEFGINGCRSLTLISQIADGGYRSSMFLATAPERKGLFKIADQLPLSDDDLSWIPREATMAAATNFDVAKAYDDLMATLDAVPMMAGPTKMAVGEFEKVAGMNLRKDILSTFKDGYFIFDAPTTGGLFFTGMTLGIEVKDAAQANALIERALTAILTQIAGGGDTNFEFAIRSSDHGAYKIKYLQFPEAPIPVMPAWCVYKDRLVMGLMPQPVSSAVDRIVAGNAIATSILANPDYQRGRKLLPKQLTSMRYNDTKRGLEGLYRLLLAGVMVGGNLAPALDADIDASQFPNFQTFTGNLYGDVSGAWVDDTGYHQAGHGPWPFPVPSMAVGGGATTAVLVSILLPSLSRARELSKRLVSASNLKGLGTACLIYAYDHNGQFPPNLQTLIDSGDILEKRLYDPNGDSSVWSYKYITGHGDNSDPRWVVAYESYPGQTEEGGNVLFADGRVEFVKPKSAIKELVEKTKQEMAVAKKP